MKIGNRTGIAAGYRVYGTDPYDDARFDAG